MRYNAFMKRFAAVFCLVLCIFGGSFSVPQIVIGQTADDLNTEIKNKESKVQEIDGLIKNYQAQIEDRKAEGESLENQIAILENRVKEKELSIQKTQTQIDGLALEIRLVDQEIASKEAAIAKQKDLLASLIRTIHSSDEVSTFDVLLSHGSLSEFFTAAEELQSLERDLGTTVSGLKEAKGALEEKLKSKEEKQIRLEEDRRTLKKDMLALEAEKNFKETLIIQTKESEKEFQRILYELRQQQQSTANEIANLEDRLKEQLNSIDDALARGDTALTWPLDPSRGITAIFHDPGYPFRNLFEHPGTDVRVPAGTTVRAAAGGYVAWNKTGKSYGNYTMIIHPGGIATIYAHLSKFLADPDTFVNRGDPIGLSGGAPGMQGAGLSTGAHLHFEVRSDGIPVDPEKYLPQVPSSYYDDYASYKKWGLRL